MSRAMPAQKPHRSKQDYGTPWELIRAVEAKYGKIAVDLAASPENAKAEYYFTEADDFFAQDLYWPANALCWVNPPFKNIGPWTEKCGRDAEQGARIVMLVPASVGAEWYARHVFGKAGVVALRPRLTFEGCDQPYPKDCILILWGMGKTGFECWRWKQ